MVSEVFSKNVAHSVYTPRVPEDNDLKKNLSARGHGFALVFLFRKTGKGKKLRPKFSTFFAIEVRREAQTILIREY